MRWHVMIGDPTIAGWGCVVAYAAAAWYCARLGWDSAERENPKIRPAWRFFTVALVLLGINKQLDFQSLFMELGRNAALSEGWYEKRRIAQGMFTIVFASLLLLAAAALLLKYPSFIAVYPLACIGMSILLLFVILRTATINHAEDLLKVRMKDHYWGWVLELLGCGCIIASARRSRK